MARKLLLFFSTFAVVTVCAFAQRTVTGTITDGDTGEGLPGATVLIKGATDGAVSNAQGQYRIEVSGDDAVLVFSFVGYESEEATVGGRSVIDINLRLDTQTLEDVVVVGYGTQSRARVTGAITQVDSEEINATPVYNAAQALQGRAAGVTVINTGSPGTAPQVRIRGLGTINDNNPLYVIDGMIGVDLNSINVADIESVEVLKDASATAIYGSRASNGVVIITTKKGQSGEPTITIDSYVGVSNVSNRFDVLNTDQYVDYTNDLQTAAGLEPVQRFTDPSWSELQNNNTDWQDEIFQTGVIQNYNIGASGGSDNAVYNVSFGYQDVEGTMIETGFERYSLRVNTEFKNKGFTFGETFNLGRTSTLNEVNSGGRSQIEHAIKSAPYLPVFDANNLQGFNGPDQIDNNDAENPVRAARLNDNVTDAFNINGTIYGEYEIIEGLKYRLTFGLNATNSTQRQFRPSFFDGDFHNADRAVITQTRREFISTLLTNALSYSTTIAGDHNIDVLAVSEIQENSFSQLNSSAENLVSNQIEEITTQDALTSNSFTNENNIISYLGRVSYSFRDKYLFTASIRADGSSRFAEDERWGTFPSVSAGWNISEEAFLSGVGAISNLKLRGSWGEVGNQNVGDYAFTSTISTGWQYRLNDSPVGGATINNLPNELLTWETTTMINIGVDFGLFNDALYGTIEYYNNQTENMIFNQPIPNSLGFLGNPPVNRGTVETSGIDLNLGYRGSLDNGLNFDVQAMMATTQNEITELGDVDRILLIGFEGDNISIFQVGDPIGSFFGWQTDGIFQTQEEVDAHATQANAAPGDIRFADLAGAPDENGNPTGPDGQINADDRTILGNYFPDVIYSLNVNLDWKNFDFNLFLNGQVGNDIFNTNIYDLEGMTRVFNAGTAVLNRWTGPGTSNGVPRAVSGDPNNNARASDRYVEDGGFLRFRNITLGYTVPTQNFLNGSISRLRVYLSGQNLITITDYSGLDPEIGQSRGAGGSGQNQTARTGIDFGNYPQPRTYLMGVQLTF